MAAESPIQPETSSRRYAALWLLVIVLHPLLYQTYLIKGYGYDALDGKLDITVLRNHQLGLVEQTFSALALVCALLLLFRPASRVFWLGSLVLMASALLTSVTNHVLIDSGMDAGLKDFLGSGLIAEFIRTGRSPIPGLHDALMNSIGPIYGVPVVPIVLGVVAAGGLVAWSAAKVASRLGWRRFVVRGD